MCVLDFKLLRKKKKKKKKKRTMSSNLSRNCCWPWQFTLELFLFVAQCLKRVKDNQKQYPTQSDYQRIPFFLAHLPYPQTYTETRHRHTNSVVFPDQATFTIKIIFPPHCQVTNRRTNEQRKMSPCAKVLVHAWGQMQRHHIKTTFSIFLCFFFFCLSLLLSHIRTQLKIA